MRIGVLDQSPVRSGGTPADAIHETLELARAADRWGYHRYWLAEHHSTPGLAGASPEVLITQVAAETSHIRVGSGGVMLPHYSALKVAEQFRMLETLHPGRIDLGIGRAPGSDQRTARILRAGSGRPRGRAVPAAGAGPGGLPPRRPARRASLARRARDARGPERPGAVAAGLERRQRAARGPSRPGLLLRPLHQRAGGRGGHARLPRAILRLARSSRAAQQRRRLRGLRGHGRAGAAPGPEPRPLHRAPLHRAARAVPVGGGGGALSLQRPGGWRSPSTRPAAAWWAPPSRCASASWRWSRTTRPTS